MFGFRKELIVKNINRNEAMGLHRSMKIDPPFLEQNRLTWIRRSVRVKIRSL